jgi:nucleoside-diphosphate-sugar epimerase
MNLSGKRIMLIGGAGLVGSHIVDQLMAEPVAEVVVSDVGSDGRIRSCGRNRLCSSHRARPRRLLTPSPSIFDTRKRTRQWRPQADD